MSGQRTGDLRRIDARFVLLLFLATALVFDCRDLAEELARLGVVLDCADSPVDLIVARANRLGDAVVQKSDLLLVTSLVRSRVVRHAGYRATTFLTRPGTVGPALIFPGAHKPRSRRCSRVRSSPPTSQLSRRPVRGRMVHAEEF